MKATPETIARVCYAANRAYCVSIGDLSRSIWECAGGEAQRRSIEGVKKVIAQPDITPEQSHENWCQAMVRDGWKRGPKRNEAKKEHPRLVNWAELPDHEKQKGALFIAIVRSFL